MSNHQVYAEISARVSEYLTESTQYSRNAKTRRLQECFAINPGISGLLDVARKTFIQVKRRLPPAVPANLI